MSDPEQVVEDPEQVVADPIQVLLDEGKSWYDIYDLIVTTTDQALIDACANPEWAYNRHVCMAMATRIQQQEQLEQD